MIKSTLRKILPAQLRKFLKDILAFKHYFAVLNKAPKGRRLEFGRYRYLTEQLRAESGLQSSPFYAFLQYREIDQLVRRWGGTNQRVLELGPGSSLGTLYCFLASGAERAVGVDIAPIEKHPEFYRILKDYLACVGAFRWWRPFAVDRSDPNVRYPNSWEDVDAQALSDRVEYFAPVAAHDLPFREDEFDLIYSCAAMEHFDKPQETVRQIRRVLAPGGLTIHGIDLRSHAPEPLSHLRWSEEEYRRLTQKYDTGHGIDKLLQDEWTTQAYCNRFLAADWRRAFTEEGLEILQFGVISELDPTSINPTQFAAPFCNRTQEELAPLIVVVVARKPYYSPPAHKVTD